MGALRTKMIEGMKLRNGRGIKGTGYFFPLPSQAAV